MFKANLVGWSLFNYYQRRGVHIVQSARLIKKRPNITNWPNKPVFNNVISKAGHTVSIRHAMSRHFAALGPVGNEDSRSAVQY